MKRIAKRLATSMLTIYLCLGVQAQERVIGDWTVIRKIDPITDRVTSHMFATAWDNPEHVSLLFREVEGRIVIRCNYGGSIQILFNVDRRASLLSTAERFGPFRRQPTIRIIGIFNRGSPQRVSGSNDEQNFYFDSAHVPKLLKDLRSARNFVFRIYGARGRELTYQTRVGGFARAYRYSKIGSCGSRP